MNTPQINPLTGLQQDPPTNAPTLNKILGSQSTIPVEAVLPQKIQGAYGEYDFAITSDVDFNEIRAQKQTTAELIGKSLGQTAATAILGTLETVGYMFDPMSAINAFVNAGQDFESNWFSQAMSDAQDYVNNTALPIYQTKQAQSEGLNRFADGTFWASNFGSTVGTGLSFLLPGMAVAKGVGVAAKLAKLSRAGTNIAQTIAPALVNRHAINAMESSEVFKTQYDKMIASGADDETARNEAGQAAAQAYKLGYLNLAGDVITWNVLLKSTGITNQGLKKSIVDTFAKSERTDLRTIAQAAMRNNTSIKDAFKNVQKAGWKEGLKNTLKSGAEEVVDETTQQFYNNLATRNSDIRIGLRSGKELDLMDYIRTDEGKEFFTSKEGIDSAILGFLGGGVFGAAGTAIGMTQTMRKEATDAVSYAQKQIAQAEYIQQQLKEIETGTIAGDTVKVDVAMDNLITDLYFRGVQKQGDNAGFDAIAKEQNIANIYEMFGAVENMTAEELQAFGLNEESRNTSKEVIKRLEQIEAIHNRYANKTWGTEIDDILAIYMTEQEYKNTKNNERLTTVKAKVNEELNSPDITQITNTFNAEEKTLFDGYRRLRALRKVKKLVENDEYSAGLSYARIERVGAIRDKIVSEIDATINEIQEQVKGVKGDTKKINSLLDSNEKLAKESEREYALEYSIKEGEQLLADLQNAETQKAIRSAMKRNNEEIQKRVSKFFFKKQVKDNEYLKEGDKVFRVNYDDDKVTLTPVDKFMQTIDGEQPLTKSFEEILDGTYTKYAPKRIFTQEQYDAKVTEIKDLISKKKLREAVDVLNNEIAGSNFTPDELSNIVTKAIEQHVNSFTSATELLNFKEEFKSVFTKTERRENFEKFIDGLIEQIQERTLAKLERIESVINGRQNIIKRANKRIEQLQSDIKDIRDRIASVDAEIKSIDGRKKEAKELKKVRAELEKQIADIEQSIQKGKDYIAQVQEDIDNITKFQTRIKETSIDEVLNELSVDTEKFRNYRQRVAHFLMVNEVTNQSLTEIKGLYEKYIETLIRNRDILKSTFDKIDELINRTENIGDAIEEMLKVLDSEGFAINDVDTGKIRSKLNTILTRIIGKKNQQELQELRQPIREMALKSFEDYFGQRDRLLATMNDSISSVQFVLDNMQDIYDTLRNPELQQKAYMYDLARKQFEIAEYLYSVSVKPTLESEKSIEYQQKSLDNPMRSAYDAFARTVGFSARLTDDNKKAAYNEDPAQRRFFRFIEKTNFHNKEIQDSYQLKAFLAKDKGFDLSNLGEKYKDHEVIYVAVVDRQGNYIDEDGEKSAEFDKDKSVYTSLSYPDWETEHFKKTYELDLSIAELRKRYDPKGELTEQRVREEHDKAMQKIIDEYKAEYDGYAEKLANGEDVLLRIHGKSNGVHQNSEELQDMSVFADTNDITFTYAKGNLTTLADGSQVTTIGGQSLILYDTETGNHVFGERRRINEEEAENVINLLKYYAANVSITKSGFVDNSKVPFLTDGVSVTDAIREYLFAFEKNENAHLNMVFPKNKEGKQIPGGELVIKYKEYEINEDGNLIGRDVKKQIPLLGQKDGKAVNELNPVLEKELRDALPEMLSNVNRMHINKTRNTPFTLYGMSSDFKLITKNYDSYIDYLSKEKHVRVKLAPKTEKITLDDGADTIVSEPSIQFHNQSLYVKPKNIKSAIVQTKSDDEGVKKEVPKGVNYDRKNPAPSDPFKGGDKKTTYDRSNPSPTDPFANRPPDDVNDLLNEMSSGYSRSNPALTDPFSKPSDKPKIEQKQGLKYSAKEYKDAIEKEINRLNEGQFKENMSEEWGDDDGPEDKMDMIEPELDPILTDLLNYVESNFSKQVSNRFSAYIDGVLNELPEAIESLLSEPTQGSAKSKYINKRDRRAFRNAAEGQPKPSEKYPYDERLAKLGIDKENWYIMPDSVKENIIKCNLS